jgi:undecaprenyl-diphosphatase
MTFLQAMVLGFVHGITEFLPISSSAHLILIPWFFGWPAPGVAFEVFLRLGSLAAVFIYFAPEWWQLFKAGIASILERRIGFDRERLYFWFILFGMIPAALTGAFLKDSLDASLRSPLLIAIALACLGFFIYWIDGKYAALRNMEELSFKDVVWVGLAQSLAIIPGVSRMGATVTMGRLLGFKREAAARFALLLSLPVLLTASAFQWHDLASDAAGGSALGPLLAGFFTAAIFGFFAIHFLLRFLRSEDLSLFAWYRIFLAALVVLWSLFYQI